MLWNDIYITISHGRDRSHTDLHLNDDSQPDPSNYDFLFIRLCILPLVASGCVVEVV
jgi:hypothetical protein